MPDDSIRGVDSSTLFGRSRHRHELRACANGLPTVSVVSVAGLDVEATVRKITACYGHLLQSGVELIVVCREPWPPARPSTAVRLIHAPKNANEGSLRSVGLAAAVGDLIMLVDDPASADESWIAHVRGASVVEALGALA